MAISLKDPETGRLARAVAALTGETLTDAIRIALAERLERETLRRRGEAPDLGSPRRQVHRLEPFFPSGDDNQSMHLSPWEPLAERLRAISAHCAALPDIDPRTPDEIVGYDEAGLW